MKILQKSLIATSLFAVISFAQAEGFYIGLNVGQANYDTTLNDFAVLDDGSITSASLDDSDTSLSLTLGYQLTPNLSLEGGYIDFGEFAVNATSDGSGFLYVPGPVTAKAATDGLFFDVKGQLPLNELFSLYGKFGFLKWDADVTLSDSAFSVTESTDDNDTFFGIGGSFNINNSMALNVDYTLYKLDDLDVDVFSVGIQLGF